MYGTEECNLRYHGICRRRRAPSVIPSSVRCFSVAVAVAVSVSPFFWTSFLLRNPKSQSANRIRSVLYVASLDDERTDAEDFDLGLVRVPQDFPEKQGGGLTRKKDVGPRPLRPRPSLEPLLLYDRTVRLQYHLSSCLSDRGPPSPGGS